MRSIPEPAFVGDTGAADPGVVAALTRYAADPQGHYRPALAALQDGRLLVPVVATAGEADHDAPGPAREKTSAMATVLMRGRDGRLALLAFTGTGPLGAWNRDARPVPVRFAQAARAAVDQGAAALVVDVAGPVLFVVEEADLRAAADGYRLVAVAGAFRWVKASP